MDAEQRDESADERDRVASARDAAANERDVVAARRDKTARADERKEAGRLGAAEQRDAAAAATGGSDIELAAEDRRLAAKDREASRRFLEYLEEYQSAIVADRRAAAEDRRSAAEDRRAAARDRQAAARAREQALLEAAEMTPPEGEVLVASSDHAAGGTDDVGRSVDALVARQTDAVESAQHAARLAAEVALSETALAATLRALAARGDRATRGRRLALAEEASTGARVASERGERLRQLADRATDDLRQTVRRALVERVAEAFEDLATVEDGRGQALDVLARYEEGTEAEDHRREAAAARWSARRARDRAEGLRLGLRPTEPREPLEPHESTESTDGAHH